MFDVPRHTGWKYAIAIIATVFVSVACNDKNNWIHFARVFKNITGETPSKYKKATPQP